MGNKHTKSEIPISVSRLNHIKVHHHVNSSFHPPNPAPNSHIRPLNPYTKRPAPAVPSTPSVTRPTPFMTEEEFLKEWHIWRNQFLLYKMNSNQTPDKQHWGNILLNLMGPIGQSIFSTFTFESSDDRSNIDVLLDKFDEYSVFLTKKRLPLENVYEYVNDLQVIAKEKNISNADEMIRKKISKEIDVHQFTNTAKIVIPTFTFSSDFNKLATKEIAFIWKLYIDTTCKRCGTNHTTNKCPALGKQCSRCNELNHFQRMCPKNFFDNCKFCGGYHERKKCPAFNEICTKCKKLNHFSWKCQNSRIMRCLFCDKSHPASRSYCPAKDVTCNNCHMKGHITLKCKQASRLHTKNIV